MICTGRDAVLLQVFRHVLTVALREAVDEPLPLNQAAAHAERLREPSQTLLAGLLGVHLDGKLLTDEVTAHNAQVMPSCARMSLITRSFAVAVVPKMAASSGRFCRKRDTRW